MNAIKLTHSQLENLTYQIAYFLFDFGNVNDEFHILFTEAVEKAYPIYKNKYNEEPELDFNSDFSVLISRVLVQILKDQFDAFLLKNKMSKVLSNQLVSLLSRMV